MPPSLIVQITKTDVNRASANWGDYGDAYSHAGPARNNPILNDEALYRHFFRDYSVGRSIRKGHRDQLMAKLRSSKFPLDRVLADESGREFDAILRSLSNEFGAIKTHKGTVLPPGSILSALSKICCFLSPAKFVAFDKYARFGVNTFNGIPKHRSYTSYAPYKALMNQTLDGQLGQAVKQACAEFAVAKHASLGRKFHWRVLDCYLMRLGGRWKPKFKA